MPVRGAPPSNEVKKAPRSDQDASTPSAVLAALTTTNTISINRLTSTSADLSTAALTTTAATLTATFKAIQEESKQKHQLNLHSNMNKLLKSTSLLTKTSTPFFRLLTSATTATSRYFMQLH